ncbi:MAG: DNA mismatch repair endonuclease MutL [Roseibacillus sp.]
MPRIHVMPDALASQVAAGEVVERPASVVKELVENSLDAGAKEVRVEIQRGGVALVKVSDDGIGMNREDAVLSLERHATSKLRDKEGLTSIVTLGFRGEALPSIASVARFRLTTRERDALEGTEITVEGGKLRDVRDAGCPPGTTVEVRDLFYNIPARRKFLRSETTEAAHIDYQVRLHALACPEARVIHRKDGRTAFDVAASSDRRVRIGDLFGRDLLSKLQALPRVEHPGMAVSGYLLPPEAARKSRRGQYLFLNGRPVYDRVVWRALEEGFRGALPAGRHPVAWLWLEMDPHLVDVNVHPAKREVRFHRPSELRALILEAVGQRSEMGAQESAVGNRGSGVGRDGGQKFPDTPVQAVATSDGDAERGRVETVAPPRVWQAEAQPEFGEEVEAPAAPAFRVVGVLEGRYLVLEASDGLVLLEGEAARERILYERFLAGAERGVPESQGLLVPVLLELEARDADVALRNAENFREAGMEVESFGGVTVQLRSLPALLSDADPKALLLDLVDELVASVESRAGRTLTFEKFAGELAKVGARGERCRAESAQALLDQLFTCDLPYCTPDGRPTLVQYSSAELRRRFGKSH